MSNTHGEWLDRIRGRKAMDELKPCPFCGGTGHISSREIRYIGQNYYGAKKIRMGMQVICGRCKARGGVITGEVIFASIKEQRECLEPLEHRAIEAWNRRTSDG